MLACDKMGQRRILVGGIRVDGNGKSGCGNRSLIGRRQFGKILLKSLRMSFLR